MNQPPIRIDAEKGTTFLVVGETVEMVRHDQPICRVPREDVSEFIRLTYQANRWEEQSPLERGAAPQAEPA